MESESVRSEVKDGVARIVLNRPDKLNSFNMEMAKALQGALECYSKHSEVRAIYITGEGKGFCAGQDLGAAVDEEAPSIGGIVEEQYNPIIRLLRRIEKPIVCGVNGTAAGAGANIAFACDITIAIESAKFIQSFSQIGLIPDSGGTWLLPRLIGLQKATALTMLGEKLPAQKAEEMGLIYKTCGDEELEEEAYGTAKKLAQMPTKGLGLTKRGLNAGLENDLSTQLDYEALIQQEAGYSHDYKEGVDAFLNKRKPDYKGH
jgi:2-(1,2-epoxy-1,2-dihydrophenyl)acetyl-CoA isomerase